MRRSWLAPLTLIVLGLGLALGTRSLPAVAGPMPECPEEGECTFKKPNILFVVDYSSSMNTPHAGDEQLTRWDFLVERMFEVSQPGSFYSQNTHMGLIRFGHDPNPGMPGTQTPGGLVDGVALDLALDDPEGEWLNCVGGTLNDLLAELPPPPPGVESWTRGGLEAAAAQLAEVEADHPEDMGERLSYVFVLSDSVWTGVDGVGMPPADDPSVVASELFDAGTPVVAVTVDANEDVAAAADELAAAGGTAEALALEDDLALEALLQTIIEDIVQGLDIPECISDRPRVMVLLDASSAMLNDGEGPASMGASTWDFARELVSGPDSVFRTVADFGTVEDMTFVGLSVFGGALEQRVLVDYVDCADDNMGWALDPWQSCWEPGCQDPWAGPPIEWSPRDGTMTRPWPCFSDPTHSHMPACEGVEDEPCSGSGRALHLGLELIASHQASYQAAHLFAESAPTLPDTLYANVLILGGDYTGESSDEQVQAPLESMFAAGIRTYVVGLGEEALAPGTAAQLEQLASWGSGGEASAIFVDDLDDLAELEQVLQGLAAEAPFDACCPWEACTWEPDGQGEACLGGGPNPGDGDGDSGEGDGDGETGEGEGGDGDGDGDGGGDGDGDGDPAGSGGEASGEGSAGTEGGEAGLDLGGRGCGCASEPRRGSGLGLLCLVLLGLVRRRARVSA